MITAFARARCTVVDGTVPGEVQSDKQQDQDDGDDPKRFTQPRGAGAADQPADVRGGARSRRHALIRRPKLRRYRRGAGSVRRHRLA